MGKRGNNDALRLALLRELEERPILWHRKIPATPPAKQRAWAEIGKNLNVPVIVARKLWMNLRTIAGKELIKIRCSGSQKGQSTWPFFEATSFVHDHIQHRKDFKVMKNVQLASKSHTYKIHNVASKIQKKYKQSRKKQSHQPGSVSLTNKKPDGKIHADGGGSHREKTCDDRLSNIIVQNESNRCNKNQISNPTVFPQSFDNQEPWMQNEDDKARMYFFKSLLPNLRNFSRLEGLQFCHKVLGCLTKKVEEAAKSVKGSSRSSSNRSSSSSSDSSSS